MAESARVADIAAIERRAMRPRYGLADAPPNQLTRTHRHWRAARINLIRHLGRSAQNECIILDTNLYGARWTFIPAMKLAKVRAAKTKPYIY